MSIPGINPPPWWDALIFGAKNRIIPCAASLFAVLRAEPLFAGKFAFDQLGGCTVVRQALPWDENAQVPRDWDEYDDGALTEWFQRNEIMTDTGLVRSCVEIIAKENKFHPVLEYLYSLIWDGENRLDEWAIKYLGCTDTEFVRAISSKWMISAVARVEQPGCKADCALVLEGVQDLGKSTVFRILGQPWFTDEIAALGTKDAAEQVRGIWLIELAELDALTRAADVAAAKAFMSRQIDRFRPAYGHRVVKYRRQCVFGGTVNGSSWQRDETGGRRWWPLACTRIDLDGLALVRDQLWAEAHTRYISGEPWWLEKTNEAVLEAAREEQDRRHETDAWESLVLNYLAEQAEAPATLKNLKEDGITIADVMIDGLYIQRADIRRDQQMRVGGILRTNGWARRRTRNKKTGVPEWRYVAPADFAKS
jgi:predicted P-loop ATPase